MANAICQAKGISPVGRNWTYTFIKRTPILTIKLGRTYECQRRLCKTPEVIESWFALVRNIINKHSILPGDMYNFDKTGFQLGQISTSKVVTSVEKQGRPKRIKPTGIK
jgi:predicted oxidoreductase